MQKTELLIDVLNKMFKRIQVHLQYNNVLSKLL